MEIKIRDRAVPAGSGEIVIKKEGLTRESKVEEVVAAYHREQSAEFEKFDTSSYRLLRRDGEVLTEMTATIGSLFPADQDAAFLIEKAFSVRCQVLKDY